MGNKKALFFIDGPGGTGKSFLYSALLATIHSKGGIALVMATSGIAASILPGGRTTHSRFKIPIDLSTSRTCRISKQSSIGCLIRESKLIVWDEAPMAKTDAIKALDKALQDLCGCVDIFGGKVIVFGGDFRQVLPVVRRGSRKDTVCACIISSDVWPSLEKLQLVENMRACLDPLYMSFLLRVGNGEEKTFGDDLIKIPEPLALADPLHESSLDELISAIYPDITNVGGSDLIVNRAISTKKNVFMDEVNSKLVATFPGELVEYLSFDEVVNPSHAAEYGDLITSLTSSGMPEHRVQLKVNAPVILLRNLDPTEGLCNGTRLVCKKMDKNLIHAQIAVGDFLGKDVFIHRIPFEPPEEEQYPVPYIRKQFLLRLCFAMTINKAQGQTLDHVGIYLREPVFSHGQLYVALSRAKKAASVKMLIQPPFGDGNLVNLTENIVYKEVLQAANIILQH
ncbi:PIF1 helicase [Striga hermonthica]|uniref:ATP-dependent DNA helicase n=1 Tax=Striga hermonthica TaxID=68872 RepID=A0A9N7ML04_STRHE|nr:PIF1 helicase [Striga hermonthica]